MKKAFFITGTDTEIGKTYTSVSLLNYFNHQGLKTAALKPIASDATMTEKGLRNDDALQLSQAMSMEFSYDQVNPFTYEAPVSPHIPGRADQLSVQSTIDACQTILDSQYDRLIIEGAGGWLCPLNDDETFADLAKRFGFPVILVVGLKLGCLNHTALTYHNIRSYSLPFAGWIANHVDPAMLKQDENIATLTRLMGTGPLAVIPHQGTITQLHFED